MSLTNARRGHLRRAVAIGVLVTLTLVAAACGSDKPSTKAAADQADPNGIIRYGMDLSRANGKIGDPNNYNGSNGHAVWFNLIYDSMLRQSPKGNQPGLALEAKYPDTGTVVLTLRQGVKFQDGTPFNAEAVKFNWDRLIAGNKVTPVLGTRLAGVKAMQSVTITGANEVTVKLNPPVAGEWRDRMLIESGSGLAVLSPTALKTMTDEQIAAAPLNLGAGPYRFKSFVAGQKVTLERWDGYWDTPHQKLAGVEFVNVAPGAATVNALVAGVIDLAPVTASDASGLTAQGIEVAKLKADSNNPGSSTLKFCTTKPPFDKLDARKAVAYALKREDFNTSAYQGFAESSSTFLPPNTPGYPAASAVANPYPYDLTKAKAALAAAGVAPGTKVSWIGMTSPLHDAVAQVFQAQMKEIGLTVEIIPSTNSFADQARVLANLESIAGSATSIGQYILPSGVANPCKYDNAAVTAAFNATQDTSKSQEQTNQAWAEAQKAFYDDLPFVIINKAFVLMGHSKKLPDPTLASLTESNMSAWGELYVKK